MIRRARLALNNRVVAWAGVIGVGLMPCPDCGLPLGLKIWPAALLIWMYRRSQRRVLHRLDMVLVRETHGTPSPQASAIHPDISGD